MSLISSDRQPPIAVEKMLEGYDSPAILVSADYQILATNRLYREQFGEDIAIGNFCYQVSHGYQVPCDQAGESCPLAAAKSSGHKERVLHIHQTPRGKEHVDVEMLPILDDEGELLYFVELLHSLPTNNESAEKASLVGSSASFNRMLGKIARVSPTDASVLLLGESGTGKELMASAIHRGSSRKDKALVTLECAGLTDTLFESELFGHVRGAFTGASNSRQGLVELADGGTLFLDEIGDVPLSMQVKLLRLIETGTFRPVGSSQVKYADFRLVCATHKDISAMVDRGEFRSDLYYRINVFPVLVPALRERMDDLLQLVNALLKRISPKKEFYLTNSALSRLRGHAFPGNIRELRNILNRAVILTDTNLIEANTLQEAMEIDTENQQAAPANRTAWVDLKTAEQRYLTELMDAHQQDKAKVAEIAGLSLRSLYRKLGKEQSD